MPSRRLRQKQLGPAPLASFDSGLSSVYNSFDEGFGPSGELPGSSHRHIGVLCQTSIMEETAVVVKTRSIACQTDRSALRDGVKTKVRKSSQSQTSFEAEPITIDIDSPAALSPASSAPKWPTVLVETRTYNKQISLQPTEFEVDRAPSPSRPQTLDLSKKQKKSPTSFSKVQKLEVAKPRPVSANSAASASSVTTTERKRSLLSKKSSDPSPEPSTKPRSSSFKSPFKRKESSATVGSSSSRSASPMLIVRQRMASLSPRRSKKHSLAKSKLEALLSHVQTQQIGTDVMDSGDVGSYVSRTNTLNRNSNRSLSSPRPPSHSLSPKPSRKGESHALSKLQQLIDRTRLSVSAQPHHSNHSTSADVHHDDGRRRSKSTPPEPEPLSQAHRVSMGDVWGFHHRHGNHAYGHDHHGHHRHSHDTTAGSSSVLSNSPSNPPSPFEPEVTKKSPFSLQEPRPLEPEIEEEEEDSDEEKDQNDSNSPLKNNNLNARTPNERLDDNEEQEKDEGKDKVLLTPTEENEDDLPTDILDKVLHERAKRDIAELRQRVRDERQKRQTFRTAPVERPRSVTREMAVVELEAYVTEAQKDSSTHNNAERIKLKLHLNQDSTQQSIDDEAVKEKEQRQASVDPDDWKRFCQQGLLNKRRSRLERSAASEASTEGTSSSASWQADFNQASFNDDNVKGKLPIPMIIETAWTPQEHRVLNVTPSPSGHFSSQSIDETHGAPPTDQNDNTRVTANQNSHSDVAPPVVRITIDVVANHDEAFGGKPASDESSQISPDNAFASDSFASAVEDASSTAQINPTLAEEDHSAVPSSLISVISSTTAAGVVEVSIVEVPSISSTTTVTMNVTPASSAAPAVPEEAPKTVLPTRKAPSAPVRKAPPPPGPPSKVSANVQPEAVSDVVSVILSSLDETGASVVPQDENAAYYPADQSTDYGTNYGHYTAAEGEAGGYYYTDEQGNYYSYGDYSQQQWDPNQIDYSSHQYGDYPYDSTGQQEGEYYDNQGVQAVLNSSASRDVIDSGRDAMLTDPSAIDTAPQERTAHHQEAPHQLEHSLHSQSSSQRIPAEIEPDPGGLQAEQASRSPLLSDSQGEDEDATTVIWNPATGQEGREDLDMSTVEDNEAFQPSTSPPVEDRRIVPEEKDDGSGIDYAAQSKHRRLSKVPYTSLDVQDDEGTTEPTENVPDEETVTPLLEAEVTEGANHEETFPPPPDDMMKESEPQQSHVSEEYAYEYDPAIYDPHGTGYTINSQEYNDYYYPQHAEGYDASAVHNAEGYYGTAETQEPHYSQESSPYYTTETSASVPSYEYSTTYTTTYPSTTDYTTTTTTTTTSQAPNSWNYSEDSQSQAQPVRVEHEWNVPTFTAYVPPAATSTSDYPLEQQPQYEEEEGYYEGYGEEEAVSQTAALPRERLFDEEELMPFGQSRPEPKKKETTVPLHLKVAKGLKPSKKKVMNLITKGKYSSGKKKDLFDDIEQSFSPGKPGESDSEDHSPPIHSSQWQEYQNMTARAEQTMGAARQKITPLQTPSSPPADASLLVQPTRHPQPPSRPASPRPKSNVDDLLGMDEKVAEEVRKPGGPPGRPPPPKGKPGRPPPPKKAETEMAQSAAIVALTNNQNIAQDTSSSVADELADFFSAPVPAPTPSKTEKLSLTKTSSSNRSSQPPKSAAPSSRATTTEIKAIARPKVGDKAGKSAAPTEFPVPLETTRPSTTPAVPQPKKSNVDDLMGLFDIEPIQPPAPTTTMPGGNVNVEPADRDPFASEDPFLATVPTPVSAGTTPSAVYTHRGANGFITRDDYEAGETFHDQQTLHENFGTEMEQGREIPSTAEPQPSPPQDQWNGTSSASTTSESWDPWSSTPAPNAPPEVSSILSQSPPGTAPPALPARPPPRPPVATPKLSRKEMFLQSNSDDSDVTFAAAFSHTRDESPGEEPAEAMKPTDPTEVAHETTVVSQVEAMIVHSQPSPTPARKTAQALPSNTNGSFTAWGDDEASNARNTFEVNFDSDPFNGNTQPNKDPMLDLVASYKNKAPEKININAETLDDSFFDPFATIVPEESPLPAQTAPAVHDEDDNFAVWEAPSGRPGTLPGKRPAGRKLSTQSNASRRTSQGSVSTPLYDDDDTQPMPEFIWDHPQTSWTLALRYPPKKTLTGSRDWKTIFVKLQDNVILLYHNVNEPKPFHELPLQGNYIVTEIAVHQELDVFTKIFTTKVEFVFYKERVGIRPGQIGKINKGQITKLGLPLEHASQNTELLKFGSLRIGVLRDFVHAIEDALFRMPMIRERAMMYKQSEIQAHVIDEFTAKVDKQGIISERKGRVRVYCLAFVSGMPEVEFGLNDIQRRGKEVVGRHDILPIYTEEWIRMENVEMHHCVSKEEHAESQMIKFVPPDACFFELVRFRVRPPRSRDLPLAIKVLFIMEGYKVGIKVEAITTDYYKRKRAQPCDDIQIRVPVPEQWIYLFRTEKLLGYGSKHAQSKKGSMMKELREKLRTAGTTQVDTSAIAVTAGSARYEHCYRSLVWRISRLPKEGQGAGSQHHMTCKLDLNSYDTMPQSFEPNAEIEFTMPAATMSHTTLRSISTTCDEPPEKWVKYLAKYEYVVEIDYKIDRGDVQIYGEGAVNFD